MAAVDEDNAPPPNHARARHVLALTRAFGWLLLAAAVASGLAYAMLAAGSLLMGSTSNEFAVLTGSGALLAGLMGLILVGVPTTSRIPGDSWRTALRPTLFAVGFGIVLMLGTAAWAIGGPLEVILLPPLHFLAAILPSLAVIAWVAVRISRGWQGTWPRFAYGGCVATSIALVIEAAVFVALASIVFLALRGTPEWSQATEALSKAVESAESAPSGTPAEIDISGFSELLLQPLILVAAFLMLGVLGPLTEELAKVGGIALRPPRGRAHAWMWGVAIGAGFGATEALALGAVALGAWPGNMLVRAGATLMHASMTGVAALGWHALVVERRRGFGLGALAAAVVGHGVWNTLALATMAGGLTGDASGMALSTVAVGLLGVTFGLIVVVFLGATRAASRAPASAEGDDSRT